jgi:hypothetical protein
VIPALRLNIHAQGYGCHIMDFQAMNCESQICDRLLISNQRSSFHEETFPYTFSYSQTATSSSISS